MLLFIVNGITQQNEVLPLRKFEDYFEPFKDNYPVMVLTPRTEQKIYYFVRDITKAKSKEKLHQIDNDRERKRWTTGVSGELAVENFLKVRFFDWRIGESHKFNSPDLRKIGLNIGIKTVEYGKFPVVHKNSKRPEIIVVKEDNRFFICGLATVEVLNTYTDDDLILNPKLRARNVKTGFYGFEHLIPFSSIEELKQILYIQTNSM